MGLEILHNHAKHTHENEQFRRFALNVKQIFEERGWAGLLIGNPSNENFYRFRADAILHYDHGLVLLDFKDYQGKVVLPNNEDEFRDKKWYSENVKDKSIVEIKAGSRFINPFKQLKSYREAFYEVIEKTLELNGLINPSRVVIANIFSGPLEIENAVPRNLPYYKIVQESNVEGFLYDLSGENPYSKEGGETLIKLFPGEKWDDKPLATQHVQTQGTIAVDQDVISQIDAFLSSAGSGVFVLESMDTETRDSWMQYLMLHADDFGIPETHLWAHSARISKKIAERAKIEVGSVYKSIYRGYQQEDENDGDENEDDDKLLEIIPLAPSDVLDDNALIILHEAHIINRSLNQTDLLRFGSGRLLEDVFKYLNLESKNRKVICIGDPYCLSFGKIEDSALNIGTLSELFSGNIVHYRERTISDRENGLSVFKNNLANSLECEIFNQLSYPWDYSLQQLAKAEVEVKLNEWFSRPVLHEPSKAVLLFSKRDAQKTNLWIKNHCLLNSSKPASGDLLIVTNNANIPDVGGLNHPKKIVNGMYFSLVSIAEPHVESIKIKQSNIPIRLDFVQISVKCLNLFGHPIADIWMLENHFLSEDGLSNHEKIAFRVFTNNRLKELKMKFPFSDSKESQFLLQDETYRKLSAEEKDAIGLLAQNYNLPKEKKFKVSTSGAARNLLAIYKAKYDRQLLATLRNTDPLVNAVFVNYGWAITVHKALGSNFSETIVNAYQGENFGIHNDAYFRWLYTAVAATETKTYIINPQDINPLSKCVFEDTETVLESVTDELVNRLLVFPNVETEHYGNKLDIILNDNVKGVVAKLSDMLEQKGHLFSHTEKKSEYLNKVFYSIPGDVNKKLVLDIYNKGEKDHFAVSNITVAKYDGDSGEISEIISKLYAQRDLNKNQNIAFDVQDYMKGIYLTWAEDLKGAEFSLALIESHNNQDIFAATKGKEYIKFRVWYGTSVNERSKGFINKIVVIEKSENHLGQFLKNIIFNGHGDSI